ncbi:MAG TPA: hypothetical protein VGS62_04035 [Streptosporangiaceae bacterium]|nr:hypothetical protein [Streptosporangiaceae bacterium]
MSDCGRRPTGIGGHTPSNASPRNKPAPKTEAPQVSSGTSGDIDWDIDWDIDGDIDGDIDWGSRHDRRRC